MPQLLIRGLSPETRDAIRRRTICPPQKLRSASPHSTASLSAPIRRDGDFAEAAAHQKPRSSIRRTHARMNASAS